MSELTGHGCGLLEQPAAGAGRRAGPFERRRCLWRKNLAPVFICVMVYWRRLYCEPKLLHRSFYVIQNLFFQR